MRTYAWLWPADMLNGLALAETTPGPLILVLEYVGFFAGWWMTGELMGGVQFGSSIVVWGVFVRTIITWNGSWSVNSLTHLFGYRNYDTKDKSRNFWPVAVWAYGEGWHNNHHADQRAAVHGHKWWEFDLTYQVIRVLMLLGIAKEVVLPRAWSKDLPESKSAGPQDASSSCSTRAST